LSLAPLIVTCSHLLLPLWGLFCSLCRGPSPLRAPVSVGFWPCFPCSLCGCCCPGFSFCCGSCWSFLVCGCFACVFCGCLLPAFVCFFLCCGVSPRFCFVCGLSCRLLVFRFCGAVALPPLLCLPPPSRLFLCGVLVQSCAGPSLWVSGCFMRRPGCLALMPGVWLCSASSLHSVSWQQRPFGPVWGFVYPLHHGAFVVVVHCAPTLRYSSS